MSEKSTTKRVGRKPTKLPEGISYKRTQRGINVTISENGRIVAVLRGYDNTRNMQKGLLALNRILNENFDKTVLNGKYAVIDLTPKKKK